MFCYWFKRINIQLKLLSEANLDIDKALRIAAGIESASKQADVMKSASSGVQRLSVNQQSTSNKPCFLCGKTNHTADNCFFKLSTCYNCKDTGHVSSM